MPVLEGPTVKAMAVLDTRALTQIKAVLFVNPLAVQKIMSADGHANMSNQAVPGHWKAVLIASHGTTVILIIDVSVVAFTLVARQRYSIVVVKSDLIFAIEAFAFKGTGARQRVNSFETT